MKLYCCFSERFSTACLLLALAFPGVPALRAQVPCTISLTSIDAGYYDVYGEHDSRLQTGLAGVTVDDRLRTPFRSFVVFQIPAFPGVITNALLGGASYSVSPNPLHTLVLHEVTNTADAVRRPWFSQTNIYNDLGDGPVYAAQEFPNGFGFYSVLGLNSNALLSIVAARGQDFVIGGEVSPVILNGDNDYLEFPYNPFLHLTLELRISTPPQPFIYTQPRKQALFTNDAVLTVGACGAEPLDYYWHVNGANTGAGGPAFYVSPLNASNAVFVVVSNSFGTVTSAVSVLAPLPVRMEWAYTNVALRTGSSLYAPFYVYSFGPSFTAFTWLKDGVPFNNPYYDHLELADAQPTNGGDYTVVASNAFGVATSAVLHVEVADSAPRLWDGPFSTTAAPGAYASVGVDLVGGPYPSFRWYHDGVPLPVTTNTTGPFLSFYPLKLSDAGSYYVVVSNRVGMVTSAVATLSVVLDPPVFTLQPQNQLSYPGRVVSFNVNVAGSPFPSLQWYFNDTPVLGARNSFLSLGNVTPASAGTYFCVASNASGVATSAVATLTVIAVPPVLSGPNDTLAPAGNYVYLTVIVSNPPVCLQWMADGTPVPGAEFCTITAASEFYNTTGFLLGASNYTAHFSAVASNEFGISTSRVASVTVTTAPPAFLGAPADITVLEGSTLFIPNYAYGAPAPRPFLYRNGKDAGAFFNGYLYLFNVTPAQSGEYVLVASNQLGMATSAPFRIEVLRIGPLDRWTRRHPTPQGNDLHAMTFGENRFVAAGDAGTIITSTNATNWSVFSADVPAELQGVTYGNGLFVCVGDYQSQAVIVTSTNGETWITQPFAPANRLRGVTFGNGQFLAVGAEAISGTARAYVSSNAVDWTTISVPPSAMASFDAVTFGNGRFIIATANGIMNSSADLLTWTNRFMGVGEPEGASFINDHFIISGSGGRIAVSSDGVNWTAITNGITPRRLYGVAYNAGLYVAAGARGTIISSADTTTWSLETSPTDDRYEDIIYGNGLFVAVGENGTIVTAYDGHQWTEQTRGVAQDLDGIAVSDDLAVVVGKTGTILTSTDGRAWDLAPLPVPLADSPADWHGVAFGDGKIVVVGDSTNVLVSTDNGVSWTPHSYFFPSEVPLGTGYLKSVIHTQGIWVAVGIDGDIFTSNDATNWTQQNTPVAFDLNDIAYGNGQFVVVGDSFPSPNATILVSTNGTNWINNSYGLGKNARAVTFANGRFVIAGNDGRFLTSTNPLLNSWSLSFSFDTYDGANLRSVTAHSNLWLAVGNRGIIVTATNTAGPWKPRLSHTVENLHGVRYFKNAFLAIGNRGVILQSDPIMSQLAVERADGNLRLLFSSPYEGVFKLQSSADFIWGDLRLITNSLGTAEVLIPLPSGSARQFFRVVAP